MNSSNVWPTSKQLLLLKAALLHNSEGKKAWDQWREKVDFDQMDPASYKLLGLVSKNPFLSSLQDPIFEKCRGVYRQTWVSNQLTWKRISSFLTRLGRPIVLLKGMALILHYYRDFGVRVIGDIDILVKREDLIPVFSFLYPSGWKSTYSRIDIANEEHLKRWHALNLAHPSGLYLDVHWSFIYENSPLLDASIWENTQPIDDPSFLIPDATALLFQACIHGTKHSPVPLIRWIADAMTLMRQETIDWSRLILLASYAHVCLPLYKALTYLKEEFEAPIPKESLQKLKEMPSLALEERECRCNLKGYVLLAAWYRYCLNRNLVTLSSQVRHLIPYLQVTARLPSPWLLPFFSMYWVLKRVYRGLFLVSR